MEGLRISGLVFEAGGRRRRCSLREQTLRRWEGDKVPGYIAPLREQTLRRWELRGVHGSPALRVMV